MMQSDRSWCGARLKYTNYFKTPNYLTVRYPEPHFTSSGPDLVFEPDTFLFTSIILNSSVPLKKKQEFLCQEDMRTPAGFKQINKIVKNSKRYRGTLVYSNLVNMAKSVMKVLDLMLS